MAMTFLLLRRIVRRAYGSYKLPPQEVDLDELRSRRVKVYEKASDNHQVAQ